jgi:hypothetical protein
MASAYDRYQLKINDKAAALVREAADAMLFARFETELVKANGSKAKVRGEGMRVMYTESRPAFDAKNRFGLPFCMPLDWKTFGDAIRAFYGLNGSKKSVQKVETPARESEQAAVDLARSEPVVRESGNSVSPLEKVRQRLQQSGISEVEFLDVLRAAQIKESISGDLLAIPEKTLRLALDSWDTVAALCGELRERRTEGK